MQKMGLDTYDGSEGKITDRENWVSKQKWPESDDEEIEPWNNSPPPAHANDEDNDEDEDDTDFDE